MSQKQIGNIIHLVFKKLIQENWSGNNRNNFLFNVLVLEMKKRSDFICATI